MAINPFIAAINQLVDEKGLSKDIVVDILEAAIAAAYRKEFGKPTQIIKVQLDPDTNDMKVWQSFDVVNEEDFHDEESQKLLEDAKKIDKKAEIGSQVSISLESKHDFGRIAAQTAKQVIIQRLREAERNMLLDEYKTREHQVINATIQQLEGDNIILNLGKASGIMPKGEQIPQERYFIGQRIKVLIAQVEDSSKGPRILVSRSRSEFIEILFKMEVPEIAAGTVEIKAISREAGSRTKMAVLSNQEGLDPVGSCVGQRGTRVQAVLAEVGDEKIDIILFNDDEKQFITNALSPAKIEEVKFDKKEHRAMVRVSEDQLSLAIGKNGQNVRLASKLTGWSIDIEKMEDQSEKTKTEHKAESIKKKAKNKTPEQEESSEKE